MTAQQPQYDPLEDRLAEQWPSGPWASEVEQFSDEDLSRLSAWIDDPAEDPDVDRLLADDPTLRRFIADLRQHGTHADPVDARLRLRLHRLMPEPTHVVARIGGWLSAAAAIVIVAVAGDRLVILRESGELVIAEASRERFMPLARSQILPGTVRAYPALASGRLFARNGDTLVAVDLR